MQKNICKNNLFLLKLKFLQIVKKNILIFILLIGISFLEGQSVISNSLKHHIKSSNKDEFIPIMIQLKSQLNLAEIKNILKLIKTVIIYKIKTFKESSTRSLAN